MPGRDGAALVVHALHDHVQGVDVVEPALLALGGDLHALADAVGIQHPGAEGALDRLPVVGVEGIPPGDDTPERTVPAGLQSAPGEVVEAPRIAAQVLDPAAVQDLQSPVERRVGEIERRDVGAA